MAPTPTLRVALFLLVADGILALYLGAFLSPLAAATLAGALAVCWVGPWLSERMGRRLGIGRILVPVAAAASAVDLVYLAESLLDGLVRLLLFLILYKLFTLQTVRDSRTVSFLAFFALVAASASAFGVGFLFVFVTFVVLATWVTLLQQELLAAEPGPGRAVVGDPEAGLGRGLLGLALGAAAAALVISAGLFFVIPRIGLAALPFRAKLGPMVTGFSDRVELGAYGEIETDATVVMRVYLPEETPDPERLPGLRWRGIVLDEFDGRAWIIRQPRRLVPRRSVGGEFWLSRPRGTGRILRQEIYLEPIGTDVVFAAPRALRLGLRADSVGLDDMGSVSVTSALARLHYTVDSELEGEPGPGAPAGSAAPPLPASALARYLQLPALPPRIPALARRVVAGQPEAYGAALALTRFLAREYRYTLALERRTALDPIEEFLFVSRAGNCEYFAASLAVMLRSLGIPARVVNGFQRGEWNPYGRYFMVRLSDAHSWVEAHVAGAGWITLDPSPRGAAEAGATLGMTRLYLDTLRMRWHRYVVNWSLGDQLGTAGAIQRRASLWRARLAVNRELDRVPRLAWPVLALLGGALALRLLPRELASGRKVGSRAPGFYTRALRLLARRGLAPRAGETAREFCARVRREAPGCAEPFGRLTASYERCRFGAARLGAGDAAELEASLAALARDRDGPPAGR